VGLAAVAALALRWANVGQALFGDELFTYEIATRPTLGGVRDGVRSNVEIPPPLFVVVAWVVQHLGDPTLWLRVPSLIASVATVPLIYLLAERTVGRRAAVVGAWFFALSPLAIFYSTEARAYALMTLLVVLATLALLKAIETNDWRWWTTLALLDAAALYSHYTSIFVLSAQAVWALWFHRSLARPLVIAHAAALLLFLPWVPSMLDDQGTLAVKLIGVLHPFTPTNAAHDLIRLAVGGPYAALVDDRTWGLVFLAGRLVVALAGLAWQTKRGAVHRLGPRSLLILALAAAAPAGTALFSALGDDMFLTRNLISSLPALVLAFAALLTALPRRLFAVAVALALTAFGLGAAGTLNPDTRRPQFDQVASFIEREANSGDVVVQQFQLPPRSHLEVYLDPDVPLVNLSEARAALRALEARGGRVFYVRPEIQNVPAIEPPTAGLAYHLVERHTWDGLVPITVLVYELVSAPVPDP